jgi:hypothetical protein
MFIVFDSIFRGSRVAKIYKKIAAFGVNFYEKYNLENCGK